MNRSHVVTIGLTGAPNMRMPWLKLWTEARNDGKLRRLTDGQHRIWFRLLCFAAEQEPPGTVRATWKVLAAECSEGGDDLLREAVMEMESLRLVTCVTCNNGDVEIAFPSFCRRQAKYPSGDRKRVAERVAKHRAGKRLRQPAFSVTACNESVTSCNAQEEEEEEEKNTPPKPPKGGTSIRSFEPPDWIPREPWDAWVEYRSRGRNKLTVRALEMAVRKLADLKAAGNDPAAVLSQTVVNGWSGLFEVKDHGHSRNGHPPAPAPKPQPEEIPYTRAEHLRRLKEMQEQ